MSDKFAGGVSFVALLASRLSTPLASMIIIANQGRFGVDWHSPLILAFRATNAANHKTNFHIYYFDLHFFGSHKTHPKSGFVKSAE